MAGCAIQALLLSRVYEEQVAVEAVSQPEVRFPVLAARRMLSTRKQCCRHVGESGA
jgi:hypothetical protein